jgi:hypothetical protein
MKTFISIALASMLIGSASAAAQEPAGRARGGFPGPGPGPGFGRGADVLGVEPLELSQPVVGVPFSADTVTEMVQQLADGNRIEQRTTGSIARDRRGRIWSERTLAGFGPTAPADAIRIVTITDPARGEQYRLDEVRKIAWRLRLPSPPPRREPPPGEGRPPLPSGQSLRTEQLEPMQFDGIKAGGTRAVLAIPAGAIGNERTIEVVNERWYATELRVVVSTKRVDPRFGDVTYRLVNIVRAEPPAELFEVPADFTVREEPRFPPPPPGLR